MFEVIKKTPYGVFFILEISILLKKLYFLSFRIILQELCFILRSKRSILFNIFADVIKLIQGSGGFRRIWIAINDNQIITFGFIKFWWVNCQIEFRSEERRVG